MNNMHFFVFTGDRAFTVVIAIITFVLSFLFLFAYFFCLGMFNRESNVRRMRNELYRNLGRANVPRRRRRMGFFRLPVFPQVLPRPNDPDHGDFDDLQMENVVPEVIELPWRDEQPVQQQRQHDEEQQQPSNHLLNMIIDVDNLKDYLYRETNV